jgi:branched-subunit amino acid transport protein
MEFSYEDRVKPIKRTGRDFLMDSTNPFWQTVLSFLPLIIIAAIVVAFLVYRKSKSRR